MILNVLFFSLYKKRSIFFFKKGKTDYNPNAFWVVTVQDWSKTNPVKVIRPLGTFNFSNVIDIDNLLIKKSKINVAFLMINE